MIDNLKKTQIAGIFKALPVDITFIDENEVVRFWNKDKTRVFKRPSSEVYQDITNVKNQERKMTTLVCFV